MFSPFHEQDHQFWVNTNSTTTGGGGSGGVGVVPLVVFPPLVDAAREDGALEGNEANRGGSRDVLSSSPPVAPSRRGRRTARQKQPSAEAAAAEHETTFVGQMFGPLRVTAEAAVAQELQGEVTPFLWIEGGGRRPTQQQHRSSSTAASLDFSLRPWHYLTFARDVVEDEFRVFFTSHRVSATVYTLVMSLITFGGVAVYAGAPLTVFQLTANYTSAAVWFVCSIALRLVDRELGTLNATLAGESTAAVGGSRSIRGGGNARGGKTMRKKSKRAAHAAPNATAASASIVNEEHEGPRGPPTRNTSNRMAADSTHRTNWNDHDDSSNSSSKSSSGGSSWEHDGDGHRCRRFIGAKDTLKSQWLLSKDGTRTRQRIRCNAQLHEMISVLVHVVNFLIGTNILYACRDYLEYPLIVVNNVTKSQLSSEHVCQTTLQASPLMLLSVVTSVFMIPLRSVLLIPIYIVCSIVFWSLRAEPSIPSGSTSHQFTAWSVIMLVEMAIGVVASYIRERRSRSYFKLHVQKHLQGSMMLYLRHQLARMAEVRLPRELLLPSAAPHRKSSTPMLALGGGAGNASSAATNATPTAAMRSNTNIAFPDMNTTQRLHPLAASIVSGDVVLSIAAASQVLQGLQSNHSSCCAVGTQSGETTAPMVFHQQHAVVCVVRVVGFAAWASRSAPSDIVAVLRRVAQCCDDALLAAQAELSAHRSTRGGRSAAAGGQFHVRKVNAMGDDICVVGVPADEAAVAAVERLRRSMIRFAATCLSRLSASSEDGEDCVNEYVRSLPWHPEEGLSPSPLACATPCLKTFFPIAAITEGAAGYRLLHATRNVVAVGPAVEEAVSVAELLENDAPCVRKRDYHHHYSMRPPLGNEEQRVNISDGWKVGAPPLLFSPPQVSLALSACRRSMASPPCALTTTLSAVAGTAASTVCCRGGDEHARRTVDVEQHDHQRRVMRTTRSVVVAAREKHRASQEQYQPPASSIAQADCALVLCAPELADAAERAFGWMALGSPLPEPTTTAHNLPAAADLNAAPAPPTEGATTDPENSSSAILGTGAESGAAMVRHPIEPAEVQPPVAPRGSGGGNAPTISLSSSHHFLISRAVVTKSLLGELNNPLSSACAASSVHPEDATQPTTSRQQQQQQQQQQAIGSGVALPTTSGLRRRMLITLLPEPADDAINLSTAAANNDSCCNRSSPSARWMGGHQSTASAAGLTQISAEATRRDHDHHHHHSSHHRRPNDRVEKRIGSVSGLLNVSSTSTATTTNNDRGSALSSGIRQLRSNGRGKEDPDESDESGEKKVDGSLDVGGDTAWRRAEQHVAQQRHWLLLRTFVDSETEGEYTQYLKMCGYSFLDVLLCFASAAASLIALLAVGVLDVQQLEGVQPWYQQGYTWTLMGVGTCVVACFFNAFLVLSGRTDCVSSILDRPIPSSERTPWIFPMQTLFLALSLGAYIITIMLSPQGGFIFESQSLWSIVMINFAILRPAYSSIWFMWLLDSIVSSIFFFRSLIRLARTGSEALDGRPSKVAMYIAASCYVITLAIRVLLDRWRREVFATAKLLDFQQEELEADYHRLEDALDAMVPAGVAGQLVRRVRAQEVTDDWDVSETSCVATPRRTPYDDTSKRPSAIERREPKRLLHPLWSASANLESDDGAFLLLEVNDVPSIQPAAGGIEGGSSSTSSVIPTGKGAAPPLDVVAGLRNVWTPLLEDINEAIPAHLRGVIQAVQCTRTSAFLALRHDGPSSGEAIAEGEMAFVVGPVEDENSARCVAADNDPPQPQQRTQMVTLNKHDGDDVRCRFLLEAATGIFQYYARQSVVRTINGSDFVEAAAPPPLRIRMVLDFGPAMGALIGQGAAGVLFGYFGPNLTASQGVLRHVEWGTVLASERFMGVLGDGGEAGRDVKCRGMGNEPHCIAPLSGVPKQRFRSLSL